ncbi:MAG: chemotaxis-specific protein-glutamate methyltransferase CheB [Desulfobacteraceae bacterium]|nr:chemotaxis-specific protein-glutamate methyltransferase CheB [Desulfobacteraceae bacterium]
MGIRVLIADDSSLARELISALLSTDKELIIAGEAQNGLEAVEKARELKPDIITMDVEMPVMNGLEAIERIMATNACPILVVTTRADANTAYAAISKGALDLVVKPDVNLEGAYEFIQKIKMLSKIKVITHLSGKRAVNQEKKVKTTIPAGAAASRIVAIASSTGGPEALSVILSGLPSSFPCPIVIAQHNSDGFIPGMVEWLKRVSKIAIKVAEEGEPLLPATAYVSPSERHMEITERRRVAFQERHPKDIYRPSCDLLLSSVARVYQSKAIGVILTGMGSDGARGMREIKSAGGTTMAQDEKTCIVYGMPKVAIESGCIDRILSLEEISGELAMVVARGAGEAAGPR